MSRYYVNCYEDDRESRVAMQIEYRRVKRDLWRTGKSKDYINRKRGMGCPNPQCGMCSARPTNKAMKKTKNNRNKDNKFNEDYNDSD